MARVLPLVAAAVHRVVRGGARSELAGHPSARRWGGLEPTSHVRRRSSQLPAEDRLGGDANKR